MNKNDEKEYKEEKTWTPTIPGLLLLLVGFTVFLFFMIATIGPFFTAWSKFISNYFGL